MALPLTVLMLTVGCASPVTEADRDPSSRATERPESTGPTAARPSPTRRPGRTGAEVIAADSRHGTMLFDGTGQAIYLFTAETTTQPTCYGECASDWPPVLTRGEPRGAGEVRDSLLGTTRRRDGSAQVTYAGHPLYYYAHEGTYQVLCHDVQEYDGIWLVVEPDGTAAPS